MNQPFVIGITLTWTALAAINFAIVLARPDLKDSWNRGYHPVFVVISFILGVNALLKGEWVPAVVLAVCGAVVAWIWWHDESNKRRRKKLKDRLAGKVVDLGGRLGVVRPHQS